MAKKKVKMKSKSIAEKVFFSVLFVIISIYILSILYSLCWGFMTSFKSRLDWRMGNYLGFPDAEYSKDAIRFGNYKELGDIFKYKGTNVSFYSAFGRITHSGAVTFGKVLLNTVVITVVTAAENALLPAIGAYLCVRFPFKFSKFLYTFLLLLMTLPIVGTYPTEIAVLRTLGLYDTLYGFLIQNFHFTGLYFFIFYAFFEGMSNSYAEAAEIDGASQFRIMTTIALPLAGKLILTVWLLKMVGHWNDYQTILLYLPTRATFAYVVYRSFLSTLDGDQPTGKVMAGLMVLAIPLIIFFIAFKDKLMGDLSLGGVKG